MRKSVCLSSIIVVPLVLGMSSTMKMMESREKKVVIEVEEHPDLEIHEGYVSQKEESVIVKKGRKTIAKIHLGEPVMVAQAEQEEKWGYFQFPNIGMAEDGTIVVSWQMKDDSPVTYGKKSSRKYSPMMSKDDGKTWMPQDKQYQLRRIGNYIKLKNGLVLQAVTPAAKPVESLTKSPRKLGGRKSYSYYVAEDLPEELQGAYISFQTEDKAKIIHTKVNDPGLIRSSYDGLLSVMWKGDFKQLSDGSLVAGVYPTFYMNDNGNVQPGGVSFYQSFDMGHNWTVIGKIPFIKDGIADKRGGLSFDEPAFEILADSTFLCVMRTGASSPMYKTFSYDRGHTWTQPEPFTPNGVKPCLMKQNNGVLVLSSGRPGIQLRFSFDGTGKKWTEPIDMVPYVNADKSYTRDVSCGYTSMIEAGNDCFYIVYSDFTTENPEGKKRKSIWVRKIKVGLE